MIEDLMLYVAAGGVDEVEAAREEGVTLWGPTPEALKELAYADWKTKAAPRFEEGEVTACFGHPNPDIWFSSVPEERVEAQSICLACPARATCDIQTETEAHGIWAGGARDGKPITLTPDLCSNGHDDWRTRKNGRRYCVTCFNETRRARRAAKAAA